MSAKEMTLWLIFVGVVEFGVGFFGGWASTRELWREDAVRNGAAHWVADTDGAAKFQWLATKEQK